MKDLKDFLVEKQVSYIDDIDEFVKDALKGLIQEPMSSKDLCAKLEVAGFFDVTLVKNNGKDVISCGANLSNNAQEDDVVITFTLVKSGSNYKLTGEYDVQEL